MKYAALITAGVKMRAKVTSDEEEEKIIQVLTDFLNKWAADNGIEFASRPQLKLTLEDDQGSTEFVIVRD